MEPRKTPRLFREMRYSGEQPYMWPRDFRRRIVWGVAWLVIVAALIWLASVAFPFGGV